jgi:hypothetical protein
MRVFSRDQALATSQINNGLHLARHSRGKKTPRISDSLSILSDTKEDTEE